MKLLVKDWNARRVWRVSNPAWRVFQVYFYLLLSTLQVTVETMDSVSKRRRTFTSSCQYLSPQDALDRVKDSSVCNYNFHPQDARQRNENDQKSAKFRTLYAGIALALLGSFQMSLNSVIVKYVSNMNASELALFRFLMLFFLSLPYLTHSQENATGIPGQRLALLLRGALGGVSLYLSYCSTKLLPIAEASVIISTTPVFVTLLARIFLKESCDCIHIISMILTILGLCMLVRLPLILLTGSTAKFGNSTYWLGFILAFLSAFLGACAMVFARKLSNVHVSVILFNFSWIAVLEMLAINFFTGWRSSIPRCGWESALVLVLGVFSFGGQLCFTFALRYEEAGTVSVTRFASRVILVFIFQTFIFKNVPDAYSISAAILVSISVILSIFRKYLKNKLSSSDLASLIRGRKTTSIQDLQLNTIARN